MGDEGEGSPTSARGPKSACEFQLREVQPPARSPVRQIVDGWLSAVLGAGSERDRTKWDVVRTDPDGRSQTVFRHTDRYAAIFEMSKLRTQHRDPDRTGAQSPSEPRRGTLVVVPKGQPGSARRTDSGGRSQGPERMT